MKKTIFSIVSIAILMVSLNCLHFKAAAQTPPTGNAEKQAILANKNFPFLSSLLSHEPLNRLVSENDEFNRILIKKREAIQSTLNSSQSRSIIPRESIVSSFEWQNEEISLVIEQIRKISSEAKVDAIFQEMKNNRQFSFQEPKSGADWIDQTLERELNGMNRIIQIYALAENPNSPQIDSLSYHVNSSYYQKVINVVALNLSDDVDAMNYFFEPTMNFALWLLEINKRDEAARFEPMELGENAMAVQQLT